MNTLQSRVFCSVDNGKVNFLVKLKVYLALACGVTARHAFAGALKRAEVSCAHAFCDQFAGVVFDPSDSLAPERLNRLHPEDRQTQH
jgi:hypothetical protein